MHDMRTRTLLFAILLSAFMLAASAPAVASDGRVAFMSVPEARVGTAAPGPDLKTMWADGTHVRTLVSVDPSGAPMAAPVWSSNRLWVAYEQMKPEGPISVVRHDGARNHVIELRGHWDVAGLSAMAWSPSGRYLVAGEDNIDSENPGRWNALVMVDLRTRTPRQLVRTKTKGNRFGSLSFSPNGRYLAVGEVDKAGKPAANYLLCVSNGGTVFTYPGANVSGIDIAPDGAHISFIQGRYDPVPDHTYKELRTATLGFKQRKTIAAEGYGAWYGMPTDVYGDQATVTRWSFDGTHVGVNEFWYIGEAPEGPWFGSYTARGRDHSVTTKQLVGQFDW